tara:strand:+ start:376 stop:609 length:234 start_codon:yes stop_codon:yes gene_type:complete
MVLTKKGKKMSEQEKQTLTFENKTYEVDSLTDEQKKLVNHTVTISQELNAITMKLEQLNVTKEIFTTKLRKSLATED